MNNMSKSLHNGPAFRAVAFDMDGTLLNTLDDIADAMNTVLAERGLPVHPVEHYRNFVGDGVVKLAERSLPSSAREDQRIGDCARRFKEVYGQNWNRKTTLYPGIAGLLDSLAELGLKMGILSNKPHAFTLEAAGFYLAPWNFAAILGQEDHRPPKPDPAGPRAMSQALGMSLPEILFIGDSGVDMQTAVRSGMYPAGVLWGFRAAEELQAAGAKTLIEHPRAILDLLGTERSPG